MLLFWMHMHQKISDDSNESVYKEFGQVFDHVPNVIQILLGNGS
jgi:hypothetical protein